MPMVFTEYTHNSPRELTEATAKKESPSCDRTPTKGNKSRLSLTGNMHRPISCMGICATRNKDCHSR